MTNTIPYLDVLVKWDAALNGFPAGVLTLCICIAAGYLWRSIEKLPNRFIPLWVMVVGGCVLIRLNWNKEGTDHFRDFLIGFVIGLIAFLAHNLVIKRVEKFIAKVAKKWLGDDDDPPNTPSPVTP